MFLWSPFIFRGLRWFSLWWNTFSRNKIGTWDRFEKRKKIILTIYHCLGYGFILFDFDFNYNTIPRPKTGGPRAVKQFLPEGKKELFDWICGSFVRLRFYPEHKPSSLATSMPHEDSPGNLCWLLFRLIINHSSDSPWHLPQLNLFLIIPVNSRSVSEVLKVLDKWFQFLSCKQSERGREGSCGRAVIPY